MFRWAKGDVLAFFTPNCVDTPVVNLGLHWAGGIASPANPTYTVDELARQLKDSGARALITQTPFLEASLKAADKVGLSRDMVLLMGDGRDQRFTHWTDVTAQGAWFAPKKTPLDPKKDLAYLVYSSVCRMMLVVTRTNGIRRERLASPRESLSHTETLSPTRPRPTASMLRASTGT